MKKHYFILIAILSVAQLTAQTMRFPQVLQWKKINMAPREEGGAALATETFEGADFSAKVQGLAHFALTFPVKTYGDLQVEVINPRYEPIAIASGIDISTLSESFNIYSRVNINRNDFQAVVRFIPIIKTGAGLQKLVSFDLQATVIPKAIPNSGNFRGGKTTSVLKEGNIFKIGIENTGIHKIDATFLKELGIDITKIDPKKIKIYGNASGILPERNNAFRADDLTENAIRVVGEEDGKFNESDYILFYAQGADRWDYDKTEKLFEMAKNFYSFNSFYFIKIDGDNGLRISDRASLADAAYTATTFDDFLRYEKESVNLLGAYNYTTGSGRDWYGDKLSTNKPSISINDLTLSNIDKDAKATLRAAVAVRSARSSTVTLRVHSRNYTANTSGVSFDPESTYASIGRFMTTFNPTSDNFSTNISVSATSGDFEAWLDFIEINARRQLIMTGSQMGFRDIQSLNYPTTAYQLRNANGVEIWNITEPTAAARQFYSIDNGVASFSTESSALQQFIAFNPNGTFLKPLGGGKVENQNLHAITRADMLIIYPKEFEAEAKDLAAHRSSFNQLKVEIASIDHVFNEFASGALDATAIRDFAKMIYERDPNFKYLLLLGDGSFNHRGIGIEADKNLNWIPVYETRESLSPIYAFPSDDYYGLLSPDEGTNYLEGSLDIAVGRITAQDVTQLKGIIEKIKFYDRNPDAMRDYRNRIVFVADDMEDGWEAAFLEHSESELWSNKTKKVNENFNGEKIYMDAFQQITTPGGQRVPDCQEAINNNIFKGCLVINYMGHGGPRSWAQERILNANEDIPTWTNSERLPLMITATCSFGGYDNPNNFTAGEQVLALDKGGAVGLFSTVRSVYQGANEVLTRSVFNEMYKKKGYNGLAMGEILRQAKNNSGSDTDNNRKFAMLGDPSQRLMIPQYEVYTTAINGKSVENSTLIDTVGALSTVKIDGVVTDSLKQVLNSFNGKVYITIFDKELNLKTLKTDKNFIQNFKTQNRVLFKGSANVKNGRFSIRCVIPKDIDYRFGFAKISYYATDEKSNDAAGHDVTHLVIGGAGKDAVVDNTPPVVEVFMDNEQFKTGGLTSKNPLLLVRLRDDIGFNVSGSSVGHDMKAVLDDNVQNSYRLNDFYEAQTDDPSKGYVRFPLFKLSDGLHKISVKAWDVANNPGEGSTEFVVATNGKSALERVMNYPNPFIYTTRFEFKHHLPEINIKAQIRIFSASGKLVKTIFADNIKSENGKVTEGIEWDGKDDFGNDLARGVYIYKINIQSIRNATLSQESEFEKLVFLR
jgi:hypothetical protein